MLRHKGQAALAAAAMMCAVAPASAREVVPYEMLLANSAGSGWERHELDEC